MGIPRCVSLLVPTPSGLRPSPPDRGSRPLPTKPAPLGFCGGPVWFVFPRRGRPMWRPVRPVQRPLIRPCGPPFPPVGGRLDRRAFRHKRRAPPVRGALFRTSCCHAAAAAQRPTALRSAKNAAGLRPACFFVCALRCCPVPHASTFLSSQGSGDDSHGTAPCKTSFAGDPIFKMLGANGLPLCRSSPLCGCGSTAHSAALSAMGPRGLFHGIKREHLCKRCSLKV